MKFAILSVMLWPKDVQLSVRVVPFEEGMLNIVTGESGSGKSALTWIVDYALGSEKCSIPVGVIRDTVDWFSVHVRTDADEFVSARRNPGDKESTGEMYLDPGPQPDTGRRPTKNTNREAVKDYLNRLAGLPAIGFDSEAQAVRFGDRPSFRDLAAFNFQPQHIVANPFTLFFKADTTEHREKLKTVFPLVLGAMDTDALAQQRELAEVEQQLKRLRREFASRLEGQARWQAEIRSFYDRAVALSLMEPADTTEWTTQQYLSALGPIPDRYVSGEPPQPAVGRAELSAERTAVLAREEDGLARQLGDARRRMSEMKQFASSARSYERNLQNQSDRFASVGWFHKVVLASATCPVCKSETSSASTDLKDVQRLAAEMQQAIATVRATPVVLDKEYADLREEAVVLERRLADVRIQRRAMTDKDAAAAAERFRTADVFRFIGQLQQALDSAAALRPGGNLQQGIDALEERARSLRVALDPQRRRERQEHALSRIARVLEKYADGLNLEHAETEIGLDIQELTLRFRNQQGRRDFLWEIGSGQNWVGYHIATMLALHEWFSGLEGSPVPGFLIVDQPSQVYFPEAWPTVEAPPENSTKDPVKTSADIEGVRRLLSALSEGVARLKGTLQVIVTEHAGSITWTGLPNVHVVGNWRQGADEFLIPRAWLRGVDI